MSEKGQVTIPKALRDRLGLGAGEVIEFSEERGRLVATKVATESPIDRVFGRLALGRSTDDVMAELRGDPDIP